MTNILLNKRMLAARAFGAAIVGLATLLPIHAYSSQEGNKSAPSTPSQPATARTFAKTQIMLDINGDTIALNSTDLTPATPLTVNGKSGRFGDLTPQQQKQLRDALADLPPLDLKALAPGASIDAVKVFMTQEFQFDIHGDKIKIGSTDPAPNTPVTVNGTTGRFGDLTPKQQQQIREQLAAVNVTMSVGPRVALPPAIVGQVETAISNISIPEDVIIRLNDGKKTPMFFKVQRAAPAKP